MLVKGATVEFTHDRYALSYQISVKIYIKVSKSQDMDLEWSDWSDIWHACRWQYHRGVPQMSTLQNNVNTQYRSFKTSRDLNIRRLAA